MICQNCKVNVQDDFRFCPSCGSPVVLRSVCPGCGKEIGAGWAACAHCGYKFTNQPAANMQHQNTYHEPKHGYYHGSSSGRMYGGHQRRKGFLGRLFSS
jgi:rRNA maturation endonuclease Nob1